MFRYVPSNLWRTGKIISEEVKPVGSQLKVTLFFSQVIIIIVVISVGLLSFTGVADNELLVRFYSFLTIALFVWSLWSWKVISSNLFNPYAIFLWSAYLFNGGLCIFDVLGMDDDGILRNEFGGYISVKFPLNILAQSLFFVLLCLAAFHLGAMIVALRKAGKPSLDDKPSQNITHKDIRLVGYLLIFLAVVPFYIVTKDAVDVRLIGEYGLLYQVDQGSGLDTWMSVLSSFFVPGIIFLLAGSKGKVSSVIISALLIATVTTSYFFIGIRSLAAMPLVAYAWVFHICIKRLPLILLLVSGVLMIGVVFPLVSIVRQSAGESYLSLDALQGAYSTLDNPLIYTLNTMGSSVYTVVGTIMFVPSSREYDYGLGYIHAILNIIPNFIKLLKFDLPYSTPDVWFVSVLDPKYANDMGGLGYSFIAEAYLAMGWAGGPIIMALLGASLARLFEWGQNEREPAKIATVAAYLCFVLHFPRGISEAYTRQFVWYCLVPYLMTKSISMYRRMRVNKSAHMA